MVIFHRVINDKFPYLSEMTLILQWITMDWY